MNRLNDATLGMYKTVDAFLTENAATITAANVPIITTYKGNLVTKIDAIRTTSEQTAKSSKGITATKAEAKLEATRLAFIVSGMLFSYADDNGKTALKTDMEKFTFAYLKNKKDEEVVDDLYLILYTATEISSATPNPLIPYGFKADVIVGTEITEPGTLTVLEEAIQTYSNLTTAPREVISTRKTYNEALENLYKETDALLFKMDRVIEGLQVTFPAFFSGYQNARIIVGPMTLRTQIVGIVSKVTNVDLGTTAPVYGAKVTIIALPYVRTKNGQTIQVTSDPVITQTDADGKYAVPTRDIFAVYIVKCSNVSGYGDKEQAEVRVKKGSKSHIDFLLEPVQAES
jgi:hypothetical protein